MDVRCYTRRMAAASDVAPELSIIYVERARFWAPFCLRQILSGWCGAVWWTVNIHMPFKNNRLNRAAAVVL